VRSRSKKIQKTKDLNFYPDRNPNPVFTLDRNGELVYSNNAAVRVLELSGSNSEKTVYPEEFTQSALNAIKHKSIEKKSFQIKNCHFSFSFCPRENEELVDVFGKDISDEVKHQNYFSIISAFATALLKAQTENDVARIIASEAIASLSIVDCVVYLVDRQDGTLKQIAAHGPKSPKSLRDGIKNPISLRFGEGMVGLAATEKKTIIINDVTQESSYVLDEEQRHSEIAVPLIAGDDVIGVIDSEHPEKNHFNDEDAKILESIASIASTRIQYSRAIEETKHTDGKYRSFVENAFGGLYILRGDLFNYANDQFCEMIGYTLKELSSPEFDIQNLVIDADKKALHAMAARALGDYSPKSYELEIKTKNDESRHLAINTCVLNDEKGHFTLGIALDITETIQSRDQLEEVVASLEKKSEELNEFAHIASHNLRAPVANLIGLLDHYNHENPADSTNKDILDKFSKTVDKLSLTLEDMHQVLRVRAKEPMEFNAINLNDAVKSVKHQLSEKIRRTNFQILTNFEVESIKYEKSHLENLFLNLISNAIKYRREEVDPIIQIHASLSNNLIKLVFKDNGLGIDLNKYGKNLFGMYKRFHSNTEGKGLGLYLVKKQLTSQGSSISVESKPNEGTCFTVFLVNKQSFKENENSAPT
jgi:PAS domain S-box-containing protein